DRRGNPIYKRDDDGAEILYPTKTEHVTLRHGELMTRIRMERKRRLDDDLPEIAEEYKKMMGL
ncbi:MAG: restriction endonuclease subunit M, partial [Muribaculum sp.]|nr:restriction endonuclease subunit M [Muribaculum sp.]